MFAKMKTQQTNILLAPPLFPCECSVVEFCLKRNPAAVSKMQRVAL